MLPCLLTFSNKFSSILRIAIAGIKLRIIKFKQDALARYVAIDITEKDLRKISFLFELL